MAAPSFPQKEAGILKGHQGSCLVVKYNNDGNYCISGGADKTIRLWNPAKATQIKTYRGHGWEVLDLDVAKDNARIASCGGDKMVFMWDVASGRTIRKFRGHDSRVNCIKFNEDNSVLITGSYDKTVKLWDCKSQNFDPIQVLGDAKDSVASVFVSQYEIITGSIDGSVRTYDIRAGMLTTDSIGQPVASVALSHDSNCILCGCLDNEVRLLDKTTCELLNEYKGHKNCNYKIDCIFSQDDAVIVSGSEDGLVYIWDLVESKILAKLKGHFGQVTALSYHPNGSALLSGSADSNIRLWKL